VHGSTPKHPPVDNSAMSFVKLASRFCHASRHSSSRQNTSVDGSFIQHQHRSSTLRSGIRVTASTTAVETPRSIVRLFTIVRQPRVQVITRWHIQQNHLGRIPSLSVVNHGSPSLVRQTIIYFHSTVGASRLHSVPLHQWEFIHSFTWKFGMRCRNRN
jgi:hypothetical protein